MHRTHTNATRFSVYALAFMHMGDWSVDAHAYHEFTYYTRVTIDVTTASTL